MCNESTSDMLEIHSINQGYQEPCSLGARHSVINRVTNNRNKSQTTPLREKERENNVLGAPGAFAAGAGPDPSFLGLATP